VDLLRSTLTIGYSLWTQKCVLLAFYKKLVQVMPWGNLTLICYMATFVITFCLSIIFTFVECRPFSLYWIVIPNPGEAPFLITEPYLLIWKGKCTDAIVQLFVVGILNIFTDLLLIALSVPILLQVHLSIIKSVVSISS
jgi:hypothetical protein